MKRLNVEKAIQAAGAVLRRDSTQVSRLRLLKLLYIADRKAIQKFGRPILGSRMVAMKHGPLHSEILDLINGQHIREPEWAQYFVNIGRNIELREQPGTDRLSRCEVELINEVVELHQPDDDFQIADITHSFKEWEDNYPDPTANTSNPIPFEHVIDAVGRSEDKDEILSDIATEEAFDAFFAQ